MTSYFSRLSPVPSFPDYSGPHKVGTIDVELPISELDSPSPCPDASLSTVQYRIFYPCEPEAPGKPVNWIPAPQRDYVSAYTRFLGAGSTLAEVLSYFPRILHYISIPVRKNAPLLQPTTEASRWPVVIFSHGLGGTRNTYSQLVGSIASHGVIVITPEHRDGSTPVSFIREAGDAMSASEKFAAAKHKRRVGYMRLSHTPSPEVEKSRNDQLKIRLWELGLIHDSLLKLDAGKTLTNLTSASLSLFQNLMDVHEPGKITFAGHSFGAATMTQFVKSTFYAPQAASAPADYEPIFTPSSDSSIAKQITAETPVVLLDVWCMPLQAASTRWLWNLPLPCYSPAGPGGVALVAVESQAFFKWKAHLKVTKRLLSPNPSSDVYDYGSADGQKRIEEPRFYYTGSSAHLSQSDFGVLFPWVTKKFLAVREPERIMKLNVRAVLQLLRERDIEVSPTSKADMEAEAGETTDDSMIFTKNQEVRDWYWLTTDLGDLVDIDEDSSSSDEEKDDIVKVRKRPLSFRADPATAVVENELKST